MKKIGIVLLILISLTGTLLGCGKQDVLSILFANSICKMSLSKTQIFLFFESENYV